MLAKKLLAVRKGSTKAKPSKVINRLSTELYYHGHPIGRAEAKDIGLDFVVDATGDLEDAIWGLYALYSDEMRLDDAYNPVLEALKQGPLTPPVPVVPPANTPPSVSIRVLPVMRDVFVESTELSLFHETQFEITLMRDFTGQLFWDYATTKDGWAEQP